MSAGIYGYQEVVFMAINKKSLLDQFITSQHRRYLSFYDFNDQQLNLLDHHLASKFSSSKALSLRLVKNEVTNKEVLAA